MQKLKSHTCPKSQISEPPKAFLKTSLNQSTLRQDLRRIVEKRQQKTLWKDGKLRAFFSVHGKGLQRTDHVTQRTTSSKRDATDYFICTIYDILGRRKESLRSPQRHICVVSIVTRL